MNGLYGARHYLRRPGALGSLGSAARHRLRAAGAWVNGPAAACLAACLSPAPAGAVRPIKSTFIAAIPSLPRRAPPRISITEFCLRKDICTSEGRRPCFFRFIFILVPCSVSLLRPGYGEGRAAGEGSGLCLPPPPSHLKFLLPCNFVAVRGRRPPLELLRCRLGRR